MHKNKNITQKNKHMLDHSFPKYNHIISTNMKSKLLNYLGLIALMILSVNLSAQVTSVNYQMKYDTANCRYDCYIVINAGSATTSSQRIQFNSQYSLVVPTGSTVSVDSSYFPLVGNEFYDGTTAAQWNASSQILAPGAAPGSDFYSITVPISPNARYNNLVAGDVVKLFSVSIVSPTNNCDFGIRIWDNATDPEPGDTDMGGSQFDNGFTIGSGSQRYNANSTHIPPPDPLVIDAYTSCNAGIEIDLTASTSNCQMPLTYAWTGPNYIGAAEDVSINPSALTDNGDYKVIVTDAIGCKDSITVTATTKPEAGANQSACAGTSVTVSGTVPNTGTWSARAGNPSVATVSGLPNGQASILFTNAASGFHYFVYTVGSCSDTMRVNVLPKPTVSITGSTSICVGFTTQLSPGIGGTWVSNSPLIASVTNAGLVTGLAQGSVTFIFTASNGCSSTTAPVTVNGIPGIGIIGAPNVCIGSTTQLTPAVSGWVSLTPAVATVGSTGIVTGITAGGPVTMRYTDVFGCINDTTVTVTTRPVVSITGSNSICVNGTTTLSPNSGGTWQSSNPAVANVNNAGVVTGLTAGSATFVFTSNATLCSSDPTNPVTVTAAPTVSIVGSTTVCVNTAVNLTPNSGGTWVSSNTLVATVTNGGVVTTIAQGQVNFTFTSSTTGCSATTGQLIINPKPIASALATTLCIGNTTVLSPSSGGTWATATPAVISILNSPFRARANAAGAGKILFTETATGCKSDTLNFTVNPRPTTTLIGSDVICSGSTTQFNPTSGGTWQSINPTVATISNAGLVTGISVGTSTFVFTSATTLCPSAATETITVNNAPVIAITGSTDICIGNTTTLTTTATSGTWISSNPAVATVNSAGVVTAVSAGIVTITFVDNVTLCSSPPSDPIIVHANPVASFQGPTTICVGGTTTVLPSSGGTWASNNAAVATITNLGVVTGVSAGTAVFKYTVVGTSCESNGLTATVSPKPSVSITGPSSLCIDSTSTLSPTSGGTWASSNNSVATVTNAGIVTAVSAGSAGFIFTTTAGCPSDATTGITVNGPPTVGVSGPSSICIGTTSNLFPSSGGTWTAQNPSVATVTNGGVVTGVAAGTATFVFVDATTGCTSNSLVQITVEAKPIVAFSGPTSICVGKTSQLTPTTGGSWNSTNPAVASVANNGLITGISPGTARFIFTNTTSLCISDTSAAITVNPGPTVSVVGPNAICIGNITNLSPNSGGTWVSNNPTIATVTNAGVVTAVAQGIATFTFTDAGGCKSQPSDATVTVNGRPTVLVSGASAICIGSSTTLSPSSGGTWVSSNNTVATVTNGGVVSGLTAGTATFTFTLTATGCPSNPTTPVTVSPAPTVGITGPTTVCIGGQTTLSPTTGGTWTSSNPSVATVTNGGIVTAKAPGIVSFSFNDASGCASSASTGDITVTQCLDPDFNSTFVNVIVPGDVSTNDVTGVGTLYGSLPQLISSPSGSIATIVMASDGTYTFVANTKGVYTYLVAVCEPPTVIGCPTTDLVITVVDMLAPTKSPVANVDIATTPKNTAVTLPSLANDRCVQVTGCTLDPALVTIITVPRYGGATASLATGDITYTPNTGFAGMDTLVYQVCVTGEPANCATAKQIITVIDNNAGNITVAADDYNTTQQETPVSGNVTTNDLDPEGDNLTVTAYSSTVAAGTLVLNSNGSYTFTPAANFYGPVDFIYLTTDDGVPNATAEATLHILVTQDLVIKVRVYLEGALINNANATAADGRPLMRDNLRVSVFPSENGARYMPTGDPYRIPVGVNGYGNYMNITSKYSHVACGTRTDFDSIPYPSTVFAVTGQNAIVDWVFVELRNKNSNTTVVATRTGLLQRDGDVVELDGTSGLRFPGIAMDNYYVVVRHRNHLGAMAKFAQTPTQLTTLVNFTVTSTPMFDFGTTKNNGFDYTGLAQKPNAKLTYSALWAGDFDGNKKIKADNPNDDLNSLFFNVFAYPTNSTGNVNFDFAYGYVLGDYDLNGKAKFDNPNDDKNMLFGQLLFYSLNQNLLLSNFDFFIQQIP